MDLKRLTSGLLLFFLFSLIPLASFSIRLTGFCVSNEGDTIKGTIVSYSNYQTPSEFRIIPSGSHAEIKIDPTHYRLVVVKDRDRFISYNGLRMINPLDARTVSQNSSDVNSPENRYDSVSVFLRYIGPVGQTDLFIFTDQLRSNFFAFNAGKNVELINKVYVKDNSVVAFPYYRQQLYNLFVPEFDSARVAGAVINLSYNESGFKELIDQLEFNKPLHEKIDPEDGLNFKAGVAISSFGVQGVNDVHVKDPENKNYLSPVIGLGYLATTKWFERRLFYLIQLKIYEFENTGLFKANYSYWYDKVINDYDTVYYHAAAEYVLLPSINVGYKILNRPQSKLLLSGGVSSYIMKNPFFVYTAEAWPSQLNKVIYTANLSIDYYFSDWVIVWGMYNLPASVDKEEYFIGRHSDLQFGVGARF